MKNALPISLNDLEAIQQRLTLLESSVSKTIGFPDYSNAEEITITTTEPYEVTENGWISTYCGGTGKIWVNDVPVAVANTVTNDWTHTQYSVFPVSIGDTVTTNRNRTSDVWFIPCK